MTYCNEKQTPCEWAQIGGGCSVSACRKVLLTPGGWPMPVKQPEFVKPPMTNADRIRAMSDEYIAETLFELYRLTMEQDGGDIASNWCDGKSGCIGEHGEVECNEERHKACILRWLQQPAEEVHHE